MSAAELLIIMLVALLVFGPNKLPMLARHLAKGVRFVTICKQRFSEFWDTQLKTYQLHENLEKAKQAAKKYHQDKDTKP